ncbi:MAG TPA: T9SS type A sorting domain-containing protein [Desulfobacteraceae bacterium]|nr:T9SS type A sorting domain-containing protein [Desulfobacteraceae bacterium]
MLKMKICHSFLLLLVSIALQAQIIETSPSIVTLGQAITVYYNSDEDPGELNNYTGDVYAHTGVIIEGSSDWQNVIESWGNNSTQPKLTYLGEYRYRLDISPDIENFYPGLTGDEKIIKLAFVFRDASTDLQTADLFVDVFEPGLNVNITRPEGDGIIRDLNEDLPLEASATEADSLVLFIDGARVFKSDDPDYLSYTVPADAYGGKWIKVCAYDMPDMVADSLYMYVIGDPVTEELPSDLVDGINYISNDSLVLVLTAPGKSNAFIIGDFNDWNIGDEGYMKQTPDGEKFWKGIGNLSPSQEYRFQYLVDGDIRIGDPYAEKVLDPWHDQYITGETYPDLIAYPEGKTTGLVTVLQTDEPEYEWTVTDFVRPAKEDLVIYELLMRDFLEAHNYLTLIDTLDYLQKLGVNAIELMPVNEFDANLSWGYNPAYYLAPDKYYGTRNDLKALIDSCHQRGIAVILDVVLNHSTGSSPMAKLYWDKAANNVTADNPWYNVTATHDFNVFHDFNHESTYTREFSKRVMKHWIEEYRVDGYRFDLSKGFTQKNTLGDVNEWGAYDPSRIQIWKDYANHILALDPGFYIILEHFAQNSEEKELAASGMMLWGNMNYAYSQLSMAYSESINWGSYKVRGWSKPHLITYMESHDEERIMFRNLNYGLSAGNYDITDFNTALDRIKLAATLFFTIPGPKMMWQFGELGYDYSIDFNGRTGEKPIKWDYYDVTARRNLFRHFSALIKLKTGYPAFRSDNFSVLDYGMTKQIKISHESMKVNVMGNFDLTATSFNGDFHNTGWWYEFFSRDSINVSDTQVSLTLQPGEYRIYTTERLVSPAVLTGVDDISVKPASHTWFTVYPNPVDKNLFISLDEEMAGSVTDIDILDMSGRLVYSLPGTGELSVDVAFLPRGMYFIRLSTKGRTATRRIIKH